MNPIKLLLVGVVSCATATTSCMRDDLGDCPDPFNARLAIITDYELQNTRAAAPLEWYDGTINNVTVYAFDSEGVYHSSWQGGAYTLGEPYTVPMNLPEGENYQFVAYTNCGISYGTYRQEAQLAGVHIEDIQMALTMPDGSRTFTEDIAHQHRGTLQHATVRATDDQPLGTVVLESQTYRVRFLVRGLPDNNYSMTVTDRNAAQGFEGDSFSSGRTGTEGAYQHVRTLQSASRAGGELTASMILLRIGDDTNTSFALSGGNFTYEKDLLETIMGAYPAGTNLTQLLGTTYDYEIGLDFSTPKVVVTVNGYNLRTDNVELE